MAFPPVPPLDHLPLMGAPDAVALIGKGAAMDYAALERATGHIAGWLARRDLPAASRVAAWLPKTMLAAILPLAVARAGHIYVPVNPLLKRQQLAHILDDAEASLLIAPGSRHALLQSGDLPAACTPIAAEELDVILADGGADPLPPGAAPLDTPCEILYTSGSTGRPKGVVLTHANLMLGAQSVASYLALTPADRTLCVLPLSFDYGQNQLFSTWLAGGVACPLDYLLARDVPRAVERHAITTLAGVPPLWVQLAETEWSEGARASLRRLTNSGGALNRALGARLRSLFPAADIYAMYGLTEAFRSTFLPPDLLTSHPDSMGRAIPHAEVLVVRGDGTLVSDDEPGELVHCGPLVAQGYWRDAERTAERFRPAPPASQYGGTAVWSGDTVRRDGDGLLYFVGRDDAMIKSAGNRISPTEIEEAATACDGIAEAVALGVPDERLGQAIVLMVRAGDDGAVERLAETLRRDLPNFMQPREIIRRESLPRNPNGKIDRVALAAEVRP